jgi:hypothetical protein
MFSSILRKNKPFINEDMKEYMRKQHNSYTQNLIEKQKGINLLVDKYVKKEKNKFTYNPEEGSTDNLISHNFITLNDKVLQIYRIPFLALWGFAYLYFRYKKI